MTSSERTQHGHVWSIVVGAGSGARFGGTKQYEMLGDTRVIDRSVSTARAVSDGVVVVVPASDVEREGGVAGGVSRSESVRNGLAQVPADADIVCVHDAARPFASTDLFEQVIAAVRNGADAAIPAVSVTDTIKIVASDGSGTVESTPIDQRLLRCRRHRHLPLWHFEELTNWTKALQLQPMMRCWSRELAVSSW